MSDKKYQFTGDELTRLLHDAIGLAYEYNRVHGRDMFAARNQAIVEVFEGLEYSENEIAAEHPLHSDGGTDSAKMADSQSGNNPVSTADSQPPAVLP